MDSETCQKVARVRCMLAEQGYDGVIINSQTNLAWLSGGRFFINIASNIGVATIWIGPDSVDLIANNIEAQRLWLEEGAGSMCNSLFVYPWYAEDQKNSRLDKLTRGLRVATDVTLDTQFRNLRMKLTEIEQENYSFLGQMSGTVIETVASEFSPGETELQVAGRMAKACLEHGMEPIVCLVGGDQRAIVCRHPLPTEQKIEKYAILVLGARRWGLVASVSRAVYFGKVSSELASKQRAVIEVDGALLAASRPGTSLGKAFRAGQSAYSRVGFPNEWCHHHQGGLVGYESREIKANANSSEIIEIGHALAWNPTIQGTKAEDTFLVSLDGLKNITTTGKFPMASVRVESLTFERPLILER